MAFRHKGIDIELLARIESRLESIIKGEGYFKNREDAVVEAFDMYAPGNKPSLSHARRISDTLFYMKGHNHVWKKLPDDFYNGVSEGRYLQWLGETIRARNNGGPAKGRGSRWIALTCGLHAYERSATFLAYKVYEFMQKRGFPVQLFDLQLEDRFRLVSEEIGGYVTVTDSQNVKAAYDYAKARLPNMFVHLDFHNSPPSRWFEIREPRDFRMGFNSNLQHQDSEGPDIVLLNKDTDRRSYIIEIPALYLADPLNTDKGQQAVVDLDATKKKGWLQPCVVEKLADFIAAFSEDTVLTDILENQPLYPNLPVGITALYVQTAQGFFHTSLTAPKCPGRLGYFIVRDGLWKYMDCEKRTYEKAKENPHTLR